MNAESKKQEQFQFHNGTINTSSKHKKTVNVYSFNSTTVQLIPMSTEEVAAKIKMVSIPQRYN